MTGVLYPSSAYRLVRWALADPRRQEIFGIPLKLCFNPKRDDVFQLQRYGQRLDTPFGVASGPHTQMAQNIATAYLCGARYIELKTVQELDTLDVSKPCINMTDLGYNCEWSQELNLDQSYMEYLKAFVLIHAFRDMGELPAAEPGFMFNMSAGYSLAGIKSPRMQQFFDRMTHCGADVESLKKEIAPVYLRAMQLEIPHCMSKSVTVSTMHGCPPEEIEKIGRYFLEERGFHTTIKLNPTLLGAEQLRFILNDTLGFSVQVPDAAFAHDLQYPDALDIIRSLQATADKAGLSFGIKLTNTLECLNQQQLPQQEQTVYMSGRALHPISINLAARLQKDCSGALDISFSGGVDAFNAPSVLACGLKPVTVCSDLLKPGGYGRLSQYPEILEQEMALVDANSLDAFVHARAAQAGHDDPDLNRAALNNLLAYADEVLHDGRYTPCAFPYDGIKTKRPLPVYDCAASPCMSACPTGQEIPRYLEYTARGDYDQAWQTITATNPFAHVQGMVCDHKCTSKCTRLNYDTPLRIREIKRFNAESNQRAPFNALKKNGLKAAIIGAGPSGLSCAYYLALHGFEVHIYDAREHPGGMAGHGIPAFRLPDFCLDHDIQSVLELGATLHAGVRVDTALFEEIHAAYDYVYLATGAQANIPLGIENDDAPGVYSQLDFLAAVRRGASPDLGESVLIVGAGNSAMDAARTVRRLLPPRAKVCIVYRRTRDEMPCALEELQESLEEGVDLLELHAPERVLVETDSNGQPRLVALEVSPMSLVPDESGGRPKPVKSGLPPVRIPASSIIAALGQRIVLDLPDSIERSSKGAISTTGYATSLSKVFAGGDAVRGASSLINAVGDGRLAASAILRAAGITPMQLSPAEDRQPDLIQLRVHQARRDYGQPIETVPALERLNFEPFTRTLSRKAAQKEAGRCLQCDLVCNVCTTVCPNRANTPVLGQEMVHLNQKAVRNGHNVEVQTLGETRIHQAYQIIHFADSCNKCGNCESFCPSAGAPHKAKARFHRNLASFEADIDGYYWKRPNLLLGKRNNKLCSLEWLGIQYIYEDEQCCVVLESEKLAAVQIQLKDDVERVDLVPICRMAIAFRLGIDISLAESDPYVNESTEKIERCFTEQP